MSAAPHVVAGLNHNVRYRGRAYHVQTEDLGAAHGHVITHLFEGGNVLAAKRTHYAELVGGPDLPRAVRQLMERQHKDMLRDLVNGALDARLAAGAAQARAYQPGELASPGSASAVAVASPAPAGPGAEPLDDSIDRAILAYLAGDHDDVE